MVSRFINPSVRRTFLELPQLVVQPIQAREGTPSVDVGKVAQLVGSGAKFLDLICIRDREHWEQVVGNLPQEVDAVMLVSNPCYPTEIWNEAPEPLVRRSLPILFWPLVQHDEPDFWKWSCADLLRALGCKVHLIERNHEGVILLKAMAVKKFLAKSRMVVFGKQNFSWNAFAGAKGIEESLGLQLVVKSLADFRQAGEKYTDAELLDYWSKRQGRYLDDIPQKPELVTALRTWFGIRDILDAEKAIGFGVNCYGDLIIEGGRDMPCLAQCLAREEGIIAACDGDFCAMTNMAMASWLLETPCMMSNLYPLHYVGALTEHFGDRLAADGKYASMEGNLARLAHCGYVGVVPPEMAPNGKARLTDWGGTYELKRDGRGVGVDSDLAPKTEFTGIEIHFNGKDFLIVHGEVLESTRHPKMPHCESSALLRLDDLGHFIRHVSREHIVITYDDHRRDFQILADVLGLNVQ